MKDLCLEDGTEFKSVLIVYFHGSNSNLESFIWLIFLRHEYGTDTLLSKNNVMATKETKITLSLLELLNNWRVKISNEFKFEIDFVINKKVL